MTEEDIENTFNPYVTKPGVGYFSPTYEDMQKIDELVNSGRTDLSEDDCLLLFEKYYYGCDLNSRRYYHPIYVCLLSQKSKRVRRWVYSHFVWSDDCHSEIASMELLSIWEAWQQYHDATAAVILMQSVPIEWGFVDQHLEALKESARKGRYGEKRLQKIIDNRLCEMSRLRNKDLAEEGEATEDLQFVTTEVLPTLPEHTKNRIDLMTAMGFEIVDE